MLVNLAEGVAKFFGRPLRWKVQAFLSAAITETEEFPYQPTMFRTKLGADKQVRLLERSFAPGFARITCEKVEG